MNHTITFVAFEEFDNLGVGYISSVLSLAGYQISVIDFREGKEVILKKLIEFKPAVVGFSIIFQYYIEDFEETIRYLRSAGINCHFTAGGHYASLNYRNLFKIIPSLDSIVRFDGEYTMRDLVNCICSGTDWEKIPGTVCNKNGKLTENPLRQLEPDLDNYPFPRRSPLSEYALGKKYATIIAGRGCKYNCSFCSIREYYKKASGPLKRIRKPEKVAEEMEMLYLLNGCSVFLFQDDDFPVDSSKKHQWVTIFCEELKKKKLNDKIIWKISCRPDEVVYKTFAMMKDHGLFSVFLGIEDGTEDGLIRLNKHMTKTKSLEGVAVLKKLHINFDYGFMPFQPSSSFNSVKENFNFLREICGDGYSSVTFLKMMPYSSTAVEKELRKDKRLIYRNGLPDYDFSDESLNQYYNYITDCFLDWMRNPEGLLNLSKLARNYISVFSNFFSVTPGMELIKANLNRIVDESNNFFLDSVYELSIIFESGSYKNYSKNFLTSYQNNIKTKHDQFKEDIKGNLSKLVILAKFQHQFCFF